MIIASSAKGQVWSCWGLNEKASPVICALRVPSGLGTWLEASWSRPSSASTPQQAWWCPSSAPGHHRSSPRMSNALPSTPHPTGYFYQNNSSFSPPPKSLVSPPDLYPPPSKHTRVPHFHPLYATGHCWVTCLSLHWTTPFISLFPHPAQC